jgi:hypothetical protein
MNPNVARKAAFDKLLSSALALRGVLDTVVDAVECADLVVMPDYASSDGEGLSFSSLCDNLDNQVLSDLHDISTRAHRTLTRAKQLRNYSLELVPTNRLPKEVLATIFQHGAEVNESCSPCQSRPSLPRFPDRVSQVCSSWRNLSINTPSLWTSIDWCGPSSIERVRLWLTRSRGSNLRVYMCYLCVSSHLQVDKFLDLICQHNSRWSHLTLHDHYRWGLVGALDAIANLPLLEGLKGLSIRKTDVHTTFLIFDLVDLKFPSITNLYIGANSYLPASHPYTQSLNLTALTLNNTHSLTERDVSAILGGCPKLQELALTWSPDMSSDTVRDRAQLTLTEMVDFKLVDGGMGMPSQSFLRRLRIPKLKEAKLYFDWIGGMAAVKEFFLRTRPPLRVLDLQSFAHGLETCFDFADLFQAVPTVEILSITGGFADIFPSTTIRHLTPTPSSHHLLPLLKTLHLTNFRCSPKDFAEMIEARNKLSDKSKRLRYAEVRCTALKEESATQGQSRYLDFIERSNSLVWEFR